MGFALWLVGAEPIVLNCLVVAKLAGLVAAAFHDYYSGVRCALVLLCFSLPVFVSPDGMSPLRAEPASLLLFSIFPN